MKREGTYFLYSNNSEQKRMVKSQKTDQVGGESDRSDQELCQPPLTTTNNRRKSVIVAQAITFTNREQPQPTTTTYQGAVHLLRNTG